MQKYAGIAPVIERSGKKMWTHWRYSCPKFLRQTFVEWAGFRYDYSFWAKAYYEQQKSKGKPHNSMLLDRWLLSGLGSLLSVGKHAPNTMSQNT